VTNESRKYGHVALVVSVDDDGFTVSEMNYEHFGRVDTRFIPSGSRFVKGFIYP
jgi:surface antigen